MGVRGNFLTFKKLKGVLDCSKMKIQKHAEETRYLYLRNLIPSNNVTVQFFDCDQLFS